MSKVELTEDEIISILKRSSLPTLVTEGREDYAALRRFEDELLDVGLSVLPAGGRGKVLGVFLRLEETSREDEIAILADRDLWVFSTVPPEYQSERVLFTDGYSLENDLYRDGALERLLTQTERGAFNQDLRELLRWYAFAVESNLAGGDKLLKCHVDRVLDGPALSAAYMSEIGFKPAAAELSDAISQDYAKLLRGKTLMSLLVRHLSYKGRPIRHREDSLLEMGATANGPLLDAIKNKVRALLQKA